MRLRIGARRIRSAPTPPVHYWATLFAVALCLALVGSASAQGPVRRSVEASEGGISLAFEIPDDLAVSAGGVVELPGFAAGGVPGEPMLPSYRFSFLLPADVDPASVAVSLEKPEWEPVPGAFDVAPAPPAAAYVDDELVVLWADKDPEVIVNGRDVSVYQADSALPACPVETPQVSRYREWNLAHVAFCPVAYNPFRQALWQLRSGVLRVAYSCGPQGGPPEGQAPARNSEKFWQRLAPELENPWDRPAFYPTTVAPAPSAGAGTDYVIITTSTIQSASTQLANFETHKEGLGYNVDIIVEAAAADDAHYAQGTTCATRSANIRSWLQARYSSWGIDYVLLIGDPHPTTFTSNRSVPMLMCYPAATPTSYSTPTDWCYAELSNTWDADTDGYPGEYGAGGTEDFQGGGIDQNGEVAVGRIPYYGTMADLDSILSKMMAYETATGDLTWRQKVLIPAAVSNFEEDTDNNATMDTSPRVLGDLWGEAVKTLATANSYGTYTLYEQTGVYGAPWCYPSTTSNAALTQANIQSEWLNQYGFVTWWAHGSQTGAARKVWVNDNYNVPPVTPGDVLCQSSTSECAWYNMWNSSNCAALNDSYPSFVYQVSCTNGHPETSNNLGYSLLKQGAIGTVSASRVSWYGVGNWSPSWHASIGDNASHAYYGFNRMVASGDKAGDALNWVKNAAGLSTWGWPSWMNCLDFNLYGDPSGTQTNAPPSITVTSPNGGESWQASTSHAITWSSVAVTGNVNIALFKGGGKVRTLQYGVPASNGTWTWDIPNGETPGTDYQIKVISASDSSVNDLSDANFTITAAPITLTAPNGGESWEAGKMHTVTWNTNGLTGNVKIWLFKGGAKVRVLRWTEPASAGSWTWYIPGNETLASDYQIKIVSKSDASKFDFSDANFSITSAPMTLTAPNGSESWPAATYKTITWNAPGVTGDVKIWLFKGWVKTRVLCWKVPASAGTWTWYIPGTETLGTDYRLKIVSKSDYKVCDYSDADFSITAAPLTVTSPNGGESWQRGTAQNITWSSTGVTGNVKIVLCKGWAKVRTLNYSVPVTDGSWSWNIPGGETIASDYQIKILSLSDPSIADYSNSSFSIIGP